MPLLQWTRLSKPWTSSQILQTVSATLHPSHTPSMTVEILTSFNSNKSMTILQECQGFHSLLKRRTFSETRQSIIMWCTTMWKILQMDRWFNHTDIWISTASTAPVKLLRHPQSGRDTRMQVSPWKHGRSSLTR